MMTTEELKNDLLILINDENRDKEIIAEYLNEKLTVYDVVVEDGKVILKLG